MGFADFPLAGIAGSVDSLLVGFVGMATDFVDALVCVPVNSLWLYQWLKVITSLFFGQSLTRCPS